MSDWIISLNQWGMQVLLALQALRTPALNSFFRLVTQLHGDTFYLLVFPAIYWCFDKRLGVRLGYLFFFGYDYLNAALKVAFHTPRPADARLEVLTTETSFAFPSGHAQGSTLFWGYMANSVRRFWFWLLAVVLVILISFSRLYLGVHYPADVIGGLLIGLLLLVLFLVLEPPLERLVLSWPWYVQMAAGIVAPLILFFLFVDPTSARAMGILIGIGAGAPLEARIVRFESLGTWAQRGLRYVVGAAILLVFYFGLSALLPAGELWRLIRYAIIGLVLIFAAPWAMLRLGVVRQELVV